MTKETLVSLPLFPMRLVLSSEIIFAAVSIIEYCSGGGHETEGDPEGQERFPSLSPLRKGLQWNYQPSGTIWPLILLWI